MNNNSQSYFTSPQGIRYPAKQVVEVLSQLASAERLDRISTVLDQRLTSLSLGVEDLHHEHNGAACLRTAEGLGIHKVFAAEVRNQYPLSELGISPKAAEKKRRIPKGITMHAHRWVDLQLYQGNDELSPGVEMVQKAQAQGYKVYGAGPRGQFDLLDLPIDEPIMVLFGNEANGLQEETMSACDGVFKIPMYGFTESFNISVSVGMVLEQLGSRIRQRLHDEGIYGELTEEEKWYWSAQWLARDMRQVDIILKELISES